jgi:predicted ribosomally synthesized peptide with nif11-like leader
VSIEQAHALIRRTAEDPDFVARLESTSVQDKRALLAAEGYGDVTLRHLSQALPESAGGELTDEEFAAVAGAGNTVTTIVSGAQSAVISATAASAAAVV